RGEAPDQLLAPAFDPVLERRDPVAHRAELAVDPVDDRLDGAAAGSEDRVDFPEQERQDPGRRLLLRRRRRAALAAEEPGDLVRPLAERGLERGSIDGVAPVAADADP